MKRIAFVIAAASLFAFAPIADRFGPIPSSIALVWLGVLLAIFASGASATHGFPLAIGTGALGAFGAGVLAPTSAAAAGAVVVLAAFVERTTRVRSRNGRALHVLLALVSGGLAGSLSDAYAGGAPMVFGIAVLVAAILAALPLLVEADDPVAYALTISAGLVGEPAKASLMGGAELRRSAGLVPLDRATSARVKTTWRSLLRLADARVRLERSRPLQVGAPGTAADAVVGMLDQRIADHVSVLSRAYTAVDAVSAARIGIDDVALKNVESMGESLDDVSRALVEVRGDPRA
jgi:MFS family permease